MIEGLDGIEVTIELRFKIDQNHDNIIGETFRDYGDAVLKNLENVANLDPNLKEVPVNYEGVGVSGYGD